MNNQPKTPKTENQPLKVALVCDWLTNVGGAEKVLLEIHKLFPNAPIFTSKYDPQGIDWFKDAEVKTGWLQIFPAKLRRILSPLRQLYFSHLDLSEYDLVISVTGAEAKSIKFGHQTTHICYCHVPTQYYWQMYDDYVKDPGFGAFNPIVRFFFKLFVKPLKKADFQAAQKPTQFVTISEYAGELIQKYYHRDATVIHPPVENSTFNRETTEKSPVENFYITTSRQVTWKRLDLAVKACKKADRKLLIIGEGPEHENLKKLAGGSDLIKFLPIMQKDDLKKYLSVAKGFIFPSLEPFGIAPVEALAVGCPVIAFSEGGALDYIEDGKNGVFFKKQTVDSLVEAIAEFEKLDFNRDKVAKTAEKFSAERFDAELRALIEEKCSEVSKAPKTDCKNEKTC